MKGQANVRRPKAAALFRARWNCVKFTSKPAKNISRSLPSSAKKLTTFPSGLRTANTFGPRMTPARIYPTGRGRCRRSMRFGTSVSINVSAKDVKIGKAKKFQRVPLRVCDAFELD